MEIQMCRWYYVLRQTSIKEVQQVCQKFKSRSLLCQKTLSKFFVIPKFIGVWVCFLGLIEIDRKSGTNWGSFTLSCLPFLKCLEIVRQKCHLKNRSDIRWDRSVILLDNKLNYQTLTKCGTEVSFGGTEGSFGFCEKTEVSFFTFFFWDKCLFHKKLLTNTTYLSN